ncbi:MAG: tetratricopeptide repeat protein [Acidimicrobiales bacterium]
MLTDQQGLEVSTDSADALAAIDGFGEAFLGYGLGAETILDGVVADPDSAMAQVLAAALFLFAESPTTHPQAHEHLSAARAARGRANLRELLMLTAVEAWLAADYEVALARHEEIAERWPRDLVSAKFGQYHAFNRGDSSRMSRLALGVLDANADRAYAHGMAAFGLEQTHELVRAEAEGRLATEMCRREPWAHHAVAHCLDANGRLDEGVAWMHGLSDEWVDCNSFMYTHNWWHTAVFHLDRDEAEAALEIFDQHVWPIEPAYSQDQIGAVSMLARLEMRGVDVGPRWEDVAPHLDQRLDDQIEPFLDLHYLYGLGRAGHDYEADTLLANIGTHVRSAPEFLRSDWSEVAEPAARAVLAHARGRWADAAAGLGPLIAEMYRIGGSHAQRDLFELLWLDALRRSHDHAGAAEVLRDRIRVRPSIPWHHQALALSLTRMGEADLAEAARSEGDRHHAALTPWSKPTTDTAD